MTVRQRDVFEKDVPLVFYSLLRLPPPSIQKGCSCGNQHQNQNHKELEHGQPFASLDDAVRFFRIYSRDEDPGAVAPETVLPRLRRTEDVQYPYYLPQTKRLGILTIRMEDLV